MTIKHLVSTHPTTINISQLVDDEVSSNEATALEDVLHFVQAEGTALTINSRRTQDDHLIVEILWKDTPKHGRRLVNARTNREE